jgi:hypothetical protein
MLTVSKLARRCGLSRSTLLYYESIGLRIPAMSIGRSDGMSITIPGDVDNAPGAKRRR